MHFKTFVKHVLLAVFSLGFALAVSAQWQWIDKDGKKVFSDRSPPGEIADKNILKRPAGASRATPPDLGIGTATATVAAVRASAPRLSGKDAQLEAKKKQAEDEEALKKKGEEEKIAKGKADNCERAKRSILTFESGVRVSTTNAKGEREIMDDKTRASETKRLQDIVVSECK